MIDDRSDDRRLWKSLATALGAELREGTSIEGASGLTHDLRALCVDEKSGRLILFSDEPNPRVAALIQGDVQATIDSAKVIVARPSIVDLGAVVRGLFDSPAAAMISMDDIVKHSERFNALGDAEKRDIFTAANWRTLDSMMGALKNVPFPVWSLLGSVLQQATEVDWNQVFEGLREGGDKTISFSKLHQFDAFAIDREYGVCPMPLYQLTDDDWELFLSGVRQEDIQRRLKELNIYQYFYPAPDQLVIGLVEKGVTKKHEIVAAVNSAPAQGHPLGEMELLPNNSSIANLVDQLGESHFVTEIDQSVKVTKAGTTARTKIKLTPRESLLSKLLNRIKLELTIRASTKDFTGR